MAHFTQMCKYCSSTSRHSLACSKHAVPFVEARLASRGLTVLGLASGACKAKLELALQNRTAESTALLKSIAAGNGTQMPARPLAAPKAGGPQATIVDTFREPELRRRMLVMTTCWAVVSLAYYGVSLGLDALGGSLYVKFFLAALIEFPAYISVMVVRNYIWLRSGARAALARRLPSTCSTLSLSRFAQETSGLLALISAKAHLACTCR